MSNPARLTTRTRPAFRPAPGETDAKWNCEFRVRAPKGVRPGAYTYRMFGAVGTPEVLSDTLVGVGREFKK